MIMAKKKVNPRRRQATMADLKRAQTKAINETITFVMAAIFTVLHDNQPDEGRWNRWEDVKQQSWAGSTRCAGNTALHTGRALLWA